MKRSIVSPKALFRGIKSILHRSSDDIKSEELPLVSVHVPQEESKPSPEEQELSRILEECKAVNCSSLTEAKDGCRAYVDIFAMWRNGKRCPRAFRPGKDKGRF